MLLSRPTTVSAVIARGSGDRYEVRLALRDAQDVETAVHGDYGSSGEARRVAEFIVERLQQRIDAGTYVAGDADRLWPLAEDALHSAARLG